MKQLIKFTLIGVLALSSVSCGVSRKLETSPVTTYIMPGHEYLSGDGLIRAWGVGKSDSESAARKKAKMEASTELASILSRTVNSTVQQYTTALSESISSDSKSLLIEKSSIVVEQTLVGATVIYDRWAKDDSTGQYTNYIVMELKGKDFLNSLYKELGKQSGLDKNLLEKIFMQVIDESSREQQK